MKVGIDAIAFSTSKYFLDLNALAVNRNVDPKKYHVGIGQRKMSIFPPNEDIVTVAIDAAQKALSSIGDLASIDMLIFATESSFDLSKSTGIYVHHFLGLREDCRVFDIKQACYSATAALRLAQSYVSENPSSKVLVIGSDIVRYSIGTPGEPTQGGGAVAFIVAQNPRIIEIENCAGVHTNNVMDFWRPNYLDEAIFDGKLSAYSYLKSLDISVNRYFEKTKQSPADIDHVCFHTPFCKLTRKANNQLFRKNSIEDTLIYNSLIGNSCSASLYICFISLLDNIKENLARKKIGFFSYGAGSVSEFFSGIISKNYTKSDFGASILNDRKEISFQEYETLYTSKSPIFHLYENIGKIKLSKIENHKRIYIL
ncbi:MAG: hydroxymethylglutaryl-CoA synthase [Holosporaceae bacterium]|jgi:hydroxymethylglutaryl-CoA synthase|nr:hydroxymethylglutaryl-CoA synthase [Holosporaceae bacterium]